LRASFVSSSATVFGTGRLIRFQPERAAGHHSTDRAGTEQDAAERGRGPIRREGLASEARAKRVNLATAKRAAASYDKTESVFTGGWMVT
jgi:hypothetical protein